MHIGGFGEDKEPPPKHIIVKIETITRETFMLYLPISKKNVIFARGKQRNN